MLPSTSLRDRRLRRAAKGPKRSPSAGSARAIGLARTTSHREASGHRIPRASNDNARCGCDERIGSRAIRSPSEAPRALPSCRSKSAHNPGRPIAPHTSLAPTRPQSREPYGPAVGPAPPRSRVGSDTKPVEGQAEPRARSGRGSRSPPSPAATAPNFGPAPRGAPSKAPRGQALLGRLSRFQYDWNRKHGGRPWPLVAPEVKRTGPRGPGSGPYYRVPRPCRG